MSDVILQTILFDSETQTELKRKQTFIIFYHKTSKNGAFLRVHGKLQGHETVRATSPCPQQAPSEQLPWQRLDPTSVRRPLGREPIKLAGLRPAEVRLLPPVRRGEPAEVGSRKGETPVQPEGQVGGVDAEKDQKVGEKAREGEESEKWEEAKCRSEESSWEKRKEDYHEEEWRCEEKWS